jgi:hypothetical protein
LKEIQTHAQLELIPGLTAIASTIRTSCQTWDQLCNTKSDVLLTWVLTDPWFYQVDIPVPTMDLSADRTWDQSTGVHRRNSKKGIMSRRGSESIKVLINHWRWLVANGYKKEASSCKRQAASLTRKLYPVIVSHKLKEKVK